MWGHRSERNAPCQACRGRRGVPWETKLAKTEPDLQPTLLVRVFFLSTQVCIAPARSHSCCVFLLWLWPHDVVLIQAFDFSSSPWYKGAMLTADRAASLLLYVAEKSNRLLAQALVHFQCFCTSQEWGSTNNFQSHMTVEKKYWEWLNCQAWMKPYSFCKQFTVVWEWYDEREKPNYTHTVFFTAQNPNNEKQIYTE